MLKDKDGNKLTTKEFFSRWKKGIEGITPLQRISIQLTGLRLQILGLAIGLIVSLIGYRHLWWVAIILLGGLINIVLQYLTTKQQKKAIESIENMFYNKEEVQEDGY